MTSATPYSVMAQKVADSLSQLEPIAEQARESLSLSMAWVGHYLSCDTSGTSALLLRGAYGCALESVSLTAFGLVRPAALSLRSHFELCLQYLYLKDHPREMDSLLHYRWQAPLPGIVKKYLREHSPHFEHRLTKLDGIKSRAIDDVYGVLSGVAHGYAINSMPLADQPVDLIGDLATVQQSLPIFRAASEVISDYYLADFSNNWMSVPPIVSDSVAGRMQGKNPSAELNF